MYVPSLALRLPIEVAAGSAVAVPVPGLGVSVPLLPISAGVIAIVNFSLPADRPIMLLSISLDACADIGGIEKCGSDIADELPLVLLLDHEISTDVCVPSSFTTVAPRLVALGNNRSESLVLAGHTLQAVAY